MKRNHKGHTAPATCRMMIPGNPLPTLCGARVLKACKCAAHYRDSRNASDARRIEAKERHEKLGVVPRGGRKSRRRTRRQLPTIKGTVKTSTWIPKSARKRTKDPIRVRPEPKNVKVTTAA